MLVLELEEVLAILWNIVSISLELVGFHRVDSRNLLQSRVNRLSLLIYKAYTKTLGDY